MKKFKISWRVISGMGMMLTAIAGLVSSLAEQKQIHEEVNQAVDERLNPSED